MDKSVLEREVEIVRRARLALDRLGPFVSLAEAAQLTGVSLTTLADAVRHGRIPALQVQGRRWLVRPSAVRLYFQITTPAVQEVLQRHLISAGMLAHAKPRRARKFEPFRPIAVEGKPVSETLVEERR